MPSNSDNYNYQITCEIDEKLILDCIDFSVYPNNILLIIGPGGSGKSTLLSILEGNPHADFSLDITTGRRIPVDKIGVLHQSSSLPHSFSTLIPHPYNPIDVLKMHWSDSGVLDILIDHIESSPKDVPKWIRRIFLFSDFVLRNEDKEFWFLDEPEQGMGDNTSYLATALLKFKKTKTIIVVTHNMELTRLSADHVLYLHYGSQRAYLPSSDFFTSDDERIKYIIKMGC